MCGFVWGRLYFVLVYYSGVILFVWQVQAVLPQMKGLRLDSRLFSRTPLFCLLILQDGFILLLGCSGSARDLGATSERISVWWKGPARRVETDM